MSASPTDTAWIQIDSSPSRLKLTGNRPIRCVRLPMYFL